MQPHKQLVASAATKASIFTKWMDMHSIAEQSGQTWGDGGATRRAGPGDAEQEAGVRRLLLGQPAGLREEPHVHRPALLHRQVPGLGRGFIT
jgi:hypothetical protein